MSLEILYIFLKHRNSDQGPISCERSPCNFSVIPELREYHITLKVNNSLGEEADTYSFNITDRGKRLHCVQIFKVLVHLLPYAAKDKIIYIKFAFPYIIIYIVFNTTLLNFINQLFNFHTFTQKRFQNLNHMLHKAVIRAHRAILQTRCR